MLDEIWAHTDRCKELKAEWDIAASEVETVLRKGIKDSSLAHVRRGRGRAWGQPPLFISLSVQYFYGKQAHSAG
jgi:hypothetical protein